MVTFGSHWSATMSNNPVNIQEFIKYVTYQEDVAVAILLNDVLNTHCREDNIERYESSKQDGNYRLTVFFNKNIRTSTDGITYDGRMRLFYDKLDASLVFPNGFYTHKIPGIDFSPRTMLSLLKKNTGIIIKEDECDVVEDDGLFYIEFKETSIFWKGRVALKSMEDINYEILEV